MQEEEIKIESVNQESIIQETLITENEISETSNLEDKQLETITLVKEEKDVFDFIKNPNKLNQLIKTNELLHINKHNHNRLVFVYSAPKVGSTSIVSSLRIFGIQLIDIIHIHDEEMLNVLGHINTVTINEIILYNKYLGKEVYVINVFRSPIERKISTFFEKIGSYHFNNHDNIINNYNLIKIIKRFNNIFPWIGNGDHFLDRYNITIPEKFDFNNKFLKVIENGINYITLRLKDSNEWGRILSNIFGFKVHLIKDYETTNKPIKNLYNNFKSSYSIPINYLNDLLNDTYLKFYYNDQEIKEYYDEWYKKSTSERLYYTKDQYKVYEEISIENSHIDKIQLDHYFDEGCICKACGIKRMETISKIVRGITLSERIVHTEAKTELIQKRVSKANKINRILSRIPPKIRGKDFKGEMKNIVNGNKFK
jgi:hypothetical protein